jgi:hypothetical protein
MHSSSCASCALDISALVHASVANALYSSPKSLTCSFPCLFNIRSLSGSYTIKDSRDTHVTSYWPSTSASSGDLHIRNGRKSGQNKIDASYRDGIIDFIVHDYAADDTVQCLEAFGGWKIRSFQKNSSYKWKIKSFLPLVLYYSFSWWLDALLEMPNLVHARMEKVRVCLY